jgi:putative SOS response-associated peptidase YedK
MCSEYHIKTKINEIADELGVPVKSASENKSWEQRIKFTLSAPVIAKRENELRVGELIFPAQPFPNSRLSQIKEDDQVVRIYDIPLWKSSFKQFPCIVPMTSFLEPAYWGKNAGEVIEFTPPKENLFFAPGIVIKPRVPATGKLNGFSLLTHTASDQMLDYHHRLLVLLKPQAAVEYLNLSSETHPEERFNFLIENRYIPEFKATKSRTMAKGWEKRVDQHLAALEDEKAYRSALRAEQVSG